MENQGQSGQVQLIKTVRLLVAGNLNFSEKIQVKIIEWKAISDFYLNLHQIQWTLTNI